MTDMIRRESTGMSIPADADVMAIGYADLIDSGEFYAVPGFGLVDEKMTLCGVPHIIIGVTYQMCTPARPRGYVSLRGIIASEDKLDEARRRGWVPNNGEIAFNPEERIIYNDGSTGIRRQVTELLHKWELIDVGNEEFTGNELYPSRFDLPWTEWAAYSQSEKQGENEVPSFQTNHLGNLFALNVSRGLRVSEYSNDKADDARTFYL
jgi:hypothetical protein